jgi:proline dehydrogenase
MKLSFDDTQRAFAHKSNFDLQKAYRLFQTFSYPWLVNNGPKLATFALSIGLPINGLIKKTIFHQFCGGETITESAKSAIELHANGIGAILDYSVEGEADNQAFIAAFEELKKVILEAAHQPAYPFAVFKCTGIGSFNALVAASEGGSLTAKQTEELAELSTRVNQLCALAAHHKVKILIDAEETWIQQAIDELAVANMREFNQEQVIVYNTIQLYRTGRIAEIQRQIAAARAGGYKLGFKLVRGAYMEKERLRAAEKGYVSPIQVSKENTDSDYDEALKLCFENKDVVSIMAGTHNESSSYLLAQLIADAQLDKKDDRFWFAQLYGMSDHISFNLAHEGYNVAKYLPYGPVKEVLPYLSRRAQENSSVKGQAGRELSLIITEMKRRKLS